MSDFTRYAIFHAPPPGDLSDFAACWLGWDAASGCDVAPPDIPGLPRPISDIAEVPRKYGVHATLKPPFMLAADTDRAQLESDLKELAAKLSPVTLDGLSLARLGGFLALVPDGSQTALSALAAQVVRALDVHRAPLSDHDLARHRAKGLTPAQETHLTRWGYPYVMDQFRFHITLTGRLGKSDAETVRRVLAPRLTPLTPRPYAICDLCLFGEAYDGRFHLLSRHPLLG